MPDFENIQSRAYQPISCELHDQIEALCVKHKRVSVHLKDGAPVEGAAVDWRTESDKAEYLIVDTNDGQKRLRLDRIESIHTDNEDIPHTGKDRR